MAGLHPNLVHAIRHDLGWRELRPVQELAIEAVLAGNNAVVLAPTAGGKTEAALFPALSQVLTERPPPVAVLYVCPIRALLNNQEERVQACCRMVGLDAFKWHGDVAASAKERFRREPAHVLMTTPESLEVMLMGERTDAAALFAGLRTVIIDEVHAFAADDRGAHLVAVLERLVRFCGRDLQRIGLSATCGNPGHIGTWMQGSSGRPVQVVDPPRAPGRREVQIDVCEDIEDAARGIASVARGRKSLVFVESRAKAERVAHALEGRGVEVFIHHSSVSRSERALAERQFASGSNAAIVCTSTMELGLDVGDLDQVLQLDAPATVASFLQRVGRTGRRPGTTARAGLYCLTDESLVQAAAIVRLADRGWVEDVRPAQRATHVLAHQILALTLQQGGLSRFRVLPWLEAAFPFAGLGEEQVQQLVQTMLEREILYEADGLLTLGRQGEELYGRRHFFELYAVFSTPAVFRVAYGREEVGYLQVSFLQGHDSDRGPLRFRLAGRAWEVVRVDWSRGRVDVRPSPSGKVPSWLGNPSMLSMELCQEMMAALIDDDEPSWLTPRALAQLRGIRQEYEGLLEPGTAPLEEVGDAVQWHTFAGGGVNRLLAAGLGELTGRKWSPGNLSLKAEGVGLIEARQGVRQLAELDWEAVASRSARSFVRGTLSKFQPCLPQEAEDRLMADRLLDVPGTVRFVESVPAFRRADAREAGR